MHDNDNVEDFNLCNQEVALLFSNAQHINECPKNSMNKKVLAKACNVIVSHWFDWIRNPSMSCRRGNLFVTAATEYYRNILQNRNNSKNKQ